MRRVPAIDLSRCRDLGDIFGSTFSLYRKNFGLFAGTLLYFDLRARHEGAPEPRVQYPAFPPDDLLLPERP